MILSARSTLVTNVRDRREERFATRRDGGGGVMVAADHQLMRIQAFSGLPMMATEIQLEVEQHQLQLRQLRRRR